MFVISPDSVVSRECKIELDLAIANNKRLIGILHRETPNVHPELLKLNWVFLRESDDFQTGLQNLLKAMDLDLEYVRIHTRLLVRSLEWHSKGRDKSLTLRGNELKEACQWLAEGAANPPQPTVLQTQYFINSSRLQSKRERVTLGFVVAGFMMTAGLAVFAMTQYHAAEARREEAEKQCNLAMENQIRSLTFLSEARLVTNNQLDALMAAVSL